MSQQNQRTAIKDWLSKNTGITLVHIANKENVSTSRLYNFAKGLSRTKKIENILKNYGVPLKVIEDTFKIDNNSDEKEK